MSRYEPVADCLRGRAILVTGAGEGLGRAVARAYAHYGAEVVLLGRTVSKLEVVYDDIVTAGGCEPAMYPMDLSGATDGDYRELAANVREKIGHLEGLVHCAAILELLTPLEFHPVDVWDETLKVNVTAPFLLTQACLPLLKDAADSAIVFASDECAGTAKGYWGAYAVSKAGLNNLATMWAQELNDTPVRVNIIDTGPVRTAMRLRTHPGAPLSSWPLPEALTPLFIYFMGPDSKGERGRLEKAHEWMARVVDDGQGGSE
ncbi:MAG: SDR family NAD(P)-dependent oxidoreductase [Acidiferrobacteraceae bacterium]